MSKIGRAVGGVGGLMRAVEYMGLGRRGSGAGPSRRLDRHIAQISCDAGSCLSGAVACSD